MPDRDADEFLSFARSPECNSPLSLSIRAPSSRPSSRSSSPDLYSPLPTLSTAHFARFFKNCTVSPNLIGISEEVVLRDLPQHAPFKAPAGKGKGLDYLVVLPDVPESSIELDEPGTVPRLDSVRPTLEPRSVTTGCLDVPKREPLVKTYIPLGHPDVDDSSNDPVTAGKENNELRATLTTENYILPVSSADGPVDKFITAPASPTRRDMDGSYEKPMFSTGTTIHDFARLPDDIRGPCSEISPRTSSPTAKLEDLPNVAKFLSMNIGDAFMDSAMFSKPRDASLDPLEQADGPVPALVSAPVPDVAKVTDVVPELPNPLDKHVKRKDQALKKFRTGVRKCRKVCLRTPVLVVIVGSELAGPTKMALDKIGSGLPSGFGEPPSLPVQLPASVSTTPATAARQRQMSPRSRSKFTKMEQALAGHGRCFIGYEGKIVGPDRRITGLGRKKPECCEDMET